MAELHIAQDDFADEIISEHPFGLLVGMLLDQQIAMEVAFAGPGKIYDRFGTLDPTEIAAIDPDEFIAQCTTPPAIHRYGKSMAERVQKLAAAVRDEYDGDTTKIWATDDANELLERLKNLPGYGDQKARIFASLLGKQLGVQPDGWREAIGPYAEEGSFRSVADVVDPDSLLKVRETKREIKAAKKAAAKKD